MRIAGAGSAFPEYYYPQAVLLAALREYWKGQIENPRMLDQLHAHAGVDGRHLVLPIERYYGLKNFRRVQSDLDRGGAGARRARHSMRHGARRA